MLYYNTVNKLLQESLLQLMKADVLGSFRLVGGTSLSLQLGHRKSIDIDLFSDADYGTIDFKSITVYLEANFSYVDHFDVNPAIGKSYLIGENADNAVKLDVYYADTFMESPIVIDTIRFSTISEIVAMKVDVVQRDGRKKDFWDLHALFDFYTIEQMMQLHEKRYPYNHDKKLIIQNFTNISRADDDFDPVCLRGKYWEFIKDDILEIIGNYRREHSRS